MSALPDNALLAPIPIRTGAIPNVLFTAHDGIMTASIAPADTAEDKPHVPLWLLALASSLAPFSMTLMVPALGGFAQKFDTDFSSVQYLLSVYLFGLAIAQPVMGYLADRFGRRPVILAGSVLFTIASLGCVFSSSLAMTVFFRFLQALGSSSGAVVVRAVVRDLHDTEGTAVVMSRIAAVMGVAPIIAPMIGGYSTSMGDPNRVFWVTTALGLLLLAVICKRLPETVHYSRSRTPRKQPAPTTSESWLTQYRSLFGSRVFMGHTLALGLMQCAFFTFVAVGADLFERHFGIEQHTFGTIWGLMALGYVLGAWSCGPITERVGSQRVSQTGLLIHGIFGLAQIGALMIFGLSPWAVLLPLLGLLATSGLAMPGAVSGAVSYRPDIAGTSSGLSSSLALVLSGAFTVISGAIYDGQFTRTAILIGLCAMLATCTLVFTRGRA